MIQPARPEPWDATSSRQAARSSVSSPPARQIEAQNAAPFSTSCSVSDGSNESTRQLSGYTRTQSWGRPSSPGLKRVSRRSGKRRMGTLSGRRDSSSVGSVKSVNMPARRSREPTSDELALNLSRPLASGCQAARAWPALRCSRSPAERTHRARAPFAEPPRGPGAARAACLRPCAGSRRAAIGLVEELRHRRGLAS